MITKPKKKETKTYLALIVIGIALVLGCPTNSSSDPVSPVKTSVPTKDATGIDGNANIVLTYDGTVVPGTGDITISHATADDIVIAVGNAQVTVAAPDTTAKTTTVTINPTDPLPEGKVTVTIPAGVFKVDTAAGADVVAFSLSFTVAPPPPVTNSVPAADATDYPANGNIVLTYSGTVVAATGDSVPKITVKEGTAAAADFVGGVPTLTANPAVLAAGNVAAQDPTTTVTLNPTADFALGKVTVTIPAGYFKVDTAAGADVAEYSLSFTAIAADTTGPALASSVPAEGAMMVAVDANIVVTFDEVVVKGTGDITSQYSGVPPTRTNSPIAVTSATAVIVNGAVVTINPPVDLQATQAHAFVIPAGAFVDSVGNANAEITISFTTQ